MSQPIFDPITTYHEYPTDEMERRAAAFYADLRRRRTVRDFSTRPIPQAVIEDCLRTAGTAPSGANMQPWHFVVVADADLKTRIRQAAEDEERRQPAKHDNHQSPRAGRGACPRFGEAEELPARVDDLFHDGDTDRASRSMRVTTT